MVIPIGIGNDSMFPSNPFLLSSFIERCKSLYGVPPRPHWVTTYYGGHVCFFFFFFFSHTFLKVV
jgi:lysosomal Pro-X carboxypeptidase